MVVYAAYIEAGSPPAPSGKSLPCSVATPACSYTHLLLGTCHNYVSVLAYVRAIACALTSLSELACVCLAPEGKRTGVDGWCILGIRKE